MITILIPTYNEEGNISRLVHEIKLCLKNYKYKILFVDDNSKDGSMFEFEKNRKLNKNVDYIIRKEKKRDFTKAFLAGLKIINTKYLCLTDCDLQHEISKIPDMIEIAESSNIDLVIGSRFIKKNNILSLSFIRNIQSKLGNFFCKIIGIKGIKDPLSGFFLIKTKTLNEVEREIQNTGFKVLLSILFNLRNHHKIKEINTNFYPRKKGDSKLNLKIQILFIKQIVNLFIKKNFS